MGLPYAPPFTDPLTSGPRMLQGINYASGAAGILDDTGKQYVKMFYFVKCFILFHGYSLLTSYNLVIVSDGSNIIKQTDREFQADGVEHICVVWAE